MRCCICWYYDLPDQSGDVPPRLGWCPELDLETKTCRIWDTRPEGCRAYPTIRDFEIGSVPKECSFSLVEEA